MGPGEKFEGSNHPKNQEQRPDRALELLQQIVESGGWTIVGAESLEHDSVEYIGINFKRKPGLATIHPFNAERRLGLVDNQERVVIAGYEVGLEDHDLYLDYGGPKDQRFVTFLEDVAALSKELDEQQPSHDRFNLLH